MKGLAVSLGVFTATGCAQRKNRASTSSRGAVLLSAAVIAVLTGVAAAAGASHAGTEKLAGTIAFIRLTPGPYGGVLFAIRADGSGLRPLTPPSTKVTTYAWSPDGTRIAYIDQGRSLWLVRPDGSGRRPLLPRSRLQSVSLSWSPDGTRIAITTNGPSARLYVIPVAGGPPVQLPGGKHVGYHVAWSPGGDEIYYDNGGIWGIRPDGSGRRQISPVGDAGSLSADGTQFVFNVAFPLRRNCCDRYRAFAVVNADGTGYHMVTSHAYNEYGEVWSPTGRRILYGRADNQGIYVIDPDSSDNQRVTRDSPPGAGWPALAWSPDGGSIVYDAGDPDNTDLYVIGVDGRGKVRLTNTPDDDIAPTWVAR
jgi:Tol biopolymer transport system component